MGLTESLSCPLDDFACDESGVVWSATRFLFLRHDGPPMSYVASEEHTSVHGGTDVEQRHFGCTLSIFLMIRSAHWTAAATSDSVLGRSDCQTDRPRFSGDGPLGFRPRLPARACGLRPQQETITIFAVCSSNYIKPQYRLRKFLICISIFV